MLRHLRLRGAARVATAALCMGLALPSALAHAADGPLVERIEGPDRAATAAAVAEAAFPDGAPVVYVASGEAFPDALAGVPAATTAGGPILLAARATVPAATAAALTRLQPARIVLLGGPAAVSDAVRDQLKEHAPVQRISGPDRAATAAQISASHFEPHVNVAYVASDANFADALSGGPLAARTRGPVLLVDRTALPASTAAELLRLRPRSIVVLGGPAAVSASVQSALAAYTAGPVERLSGGDRYATAGAVAHRVASPAPTVVLATGQDFPDGLTGGVAAGTARGPLLLTRRDCVPPPTLAHLARLRPDRVLLVGGPSAVGPAVEHLAPCGAPTGAAVD